MDTLGVTPRSLSVEADHFRVFARERFRSEPEAATCLGGPSGSNGSLSLEDFSRALRISGYGRPPERLFSQLARDGVVAVRDLLSDCGLPEVPASSAFGDLILTHDTLVAQEHRSALLPTEGSSIVRLERQLGNDVAELRHEMSGIRLQLQDVVTQEGLLGERNGRENGEVSMRQLISKLEETVARETVTVRADNADLRTSLTEALRLLAEERKERQQDTTDNSRRIKDLQLWAEERTHRIEGVSRGAQQQANENKACVQEIEQLREMSEYRVMAAIAEESRSRELSIQRETKAREIASAELDTRWRGLLGEERLSRSKETETLSLQLARFDDAQRNECEMQQQRNADIAARIDHAVGDCREEARARQTDFSQLHAIVEDIRASLDAEVRSRQSCEEDLLKRSEEFKKGSETASERSDHELAVMKQCVLDLREKFQIETASREEAVSRFVVLVEEEARGRDDQSRKETLQRETAEAKLEQHFRAILHEERTLREETHSELEAKVVATQQELSFEKARSTAQSREVSQAVSQTREALANETAARRHEVAAAAKAAEEICISLQDETATRERLESRLIEQVGALDRTLREEVMSRETVEQMLMSQGASLQLSMEREQLAREEAVFAQAANLEEERRLREETCERESRARENVDQQLMTKLERLWAEEQQAREKGLRALELRAQSDEQAIIVERTEREEHQRCIGARLAETDASISETRQRVRDMLQRCDEMGSLREQLQAETAERQAGDAGLELIVKEQKIRGDQVQQTRELSERRLDRRLGEMTERLDVEAEERSAASAEAATGLASEREERAVAIAAERRHAEEELEKRVAVLRAQELEERRIREQAVAALEKRCLEIREVADDAKKWRIEQYNELVLELSKLAEMLTEESQARQQQDQVLGSELSRFREEIIEEASTRKLAVHGVREEVKDVLERLERDRELCLSKEKERWAAIDVLRDDSAAESSRRDGADEQLKQLIDREILTREEVLAGATRAWQRANAKTNEEWRQAVRCETGQREEATLRVEQQIVENRSGLEEVRSVTDQREEENSQRFKALSEALAVEDSTRKSQERLLQQATSEVQRLVSIEAAERVASVQRFSDLVNSVEVSVRNEAALREDGERRLAKDALEMQARLQEERATREEADLKLERLLGLEVAQRDESQAREVRVREEADASIVALWQRGLREEQVGREDERKDFAVRLQQLHREMQQEREERGKSCRDLTTTLARAQSLQKEEEETRVEQGERLGSAVESLQEAVRTLGPQREEILRKSMEAVDKVQTALNKEAVARMGRAETLEEAVREVRLAIVDEVQNREAALRSLSETVVEERVTREDASARERRITEEELARAQQSSRKVREDEERRLQERILEVTSAVSEERDLREEGMRQERQRSIDNYEEFSKEQKGFDREIAKFSQQLAKVSEAEVRRVKEADVRLSTLSERLEESHAALSSEAMKRETGVRNLEQRVAEIHNLVSADAKESSESAADLRKSIAVEIGASIDAIAAERRLREAADMQGVEAWKASIRDERETREAELLQFSRETAALKLQLANEAGKREDERSASHQVIQMLKVDLAEIHGERKVDVVAMREAFGQVSDELKAAQRSRKDDIERVDSGLATLSSRVDQNSRIARDQTFALEQALQTVQSEVQREIDERSAVLENLEARVNEEHRSAETSIAGEAKLREEAVKIADDGSKQRLLEEARKTKALIDKLSSQITVLANDVEKYRETHSEQAHAVVKDIMALQGAVSTEEQVRQQLGWQSHRNLELVREEIATESKERRSQTAAIGEDLILVQRALQQREERTEGVAHQCNAETNELRERISRETRLREASISQVEHDLANAKSVSDWVPNKQHPNTSAAGLSTEMAEVREHWRQADEHMEQTRRAIVALQGETQSLDRAMGGLDERCENGRASVSSLKLQISELQNRQKVLAEIESQLLTIREDLKKEAMDRRAEDERIASRAAETDDRLETVGQQHIKAESALRQEVLEVKAAIKKETRDRDLAEASTSQLVVEEARQREETVEREGRLRKDGEDRLAEAFHTAIREERRLREKEDIRLEGRSLSLSTKASGSLALEGSNQEAGVMLEQRAMRQGLLELQDRVSQNESRQKTGEERTVSMLDAIMSGLASADAST